MNGFSKPFRLMNSHTQKLNNRRYIERHTKTGNQEKVSCFFASIFGILKNRQYYAVQRRIDRNFLSCLANPQAVRGGRAKRNFHKFPQITVIFAFCGFVGSRGKNIAVTLAKSPLAALKVLRKPTQRKPLLS